MTLADALAEVVVPAVRAVFKNGEVTAVTVTFDPELLGGSIALSLTAVGEEFDDVVVQGDVTGYSVDDWRERLRSDLADFVAESRLGWGQDRGV
jgi:hypothetical protein